MRKLALIFGTPLFIAILIGVLYWKYFRGVWPAVLEPKQDIVQLIDKSNTSAVTTETSATETSAPETGSTAGTEKTTTADENTTGFPLKMPDGFSISVFAKGLDNPRVLVRDPNGVFLVSDTGAGKVYALPDNDKDGNADDKVIVADNLKSPHGMAFKCDTSDCKLYIAETDKVAVYDYDKKAFKASNKKNLADLPSGGGHYTRTLFFRPAPNDDELLVSIGSTCNVCFEKDSRRASIWVLNTADGTFKPFATGLRNSVFIAQHPLTSDIWATEMGRDLLGDDVPPDEINIIYGGRDYGWPYCYGDNIHDSSFDKNGDESTCADREPSFIDIQAHSAPLGLAFFNSNWPDEYKNDLLVAYHGSWNRSVPTGYKIVRYHMDEQGDPIYNEDFISGWLTSDESALGRPVGILITEDKSIYVSDDKAGVVYKVTYNK